MELDKPYIMKPKISVILPIYNQQAQLAFLYEQYTSKLPTLNVTWELMFVVNGSKDDSYKIAQQYTEQNPNVKCYNLEKGGWGRAVKFGLGEATGELICYTNSARTAVEDLILVLRCALANEGIVIKTTRVIRESMVRKIGSILYNYENRLLLGTPLWDVNGTPKVIPSQYMEGLNIFSEGDLIDAEIMAKLFRKNAPLVEILITSTKRISGKSTTKFSSAWKMYKGLFNLKKRI
jgi:glycosyltransferase involved in cell wall biosynthesis